MEILIPKMDGVETLKKLKERKDFDLTANVVNQ